MDATLEKVFVDIPCQDMVFFRFFADKMGWKINFQQDLWEKYMNSCPKGVELSD
jgi:hypothetical protein